MDTGSLRPTTTATMATTQATRPAVDAPNPNPVRGASPLIATDDRRRPLHSHHVVAGGEVPAAGSFSGSDERIPVTASQTQGGGASIATTTTTTTAAAAVDAASHDDGAAPLSVSLDPSVRHLVDACVVWGCPSATRVRHYVDAVRPVARHAEPSQVENRRYLALIHDLLTQSPWLDANCWRRTLHTHLLDIERRYVVASKPLQDADVVAAAAVDNTADRLQLFQRRNAFFLARIPAAETTAERTNTPLSPPSPQTSARPFDIVPAGCTDLVFANWPSGRNGHVAYTLVPVDRRLVAPSSQRRTPQKEVSSSPSAAAATAATTSLLVVEEIPCGPPTTFYAHPPLTDPRALDAWLSSKRARNYPTLAFSLQCYDGDAYFARTAVLQRLMRLELEQLLSDDRFFGLGPNATATAGVPATPTQPTQPTPPIHLEDVLQTADSSAGVHIPTATSKRPSSSRFAAEERLLEWLQSTFARAYPVRWREEPERARDAAQCAAARDRVFSASTAYFAPLVHRTRFMVRLLVFHTLARAFSCRTCALLDEPTPLLSPAARTDDDKGPLVPTSSPPSRQFILRLLHAIPALPESDNARRSVRDYYGGALNQPLPHVEWRRAERWLSAVSSVLDFVLQNDTQAAAVAALPLVPRAKGGDGATRPLQVPSLSDLLRQLWNRRARQALTLRALYTDHVLVHAYSHHTYPPRPLHLSLWVCLEAFRWFLYVFSTWDPQFMSNVEWPFERLFEMVFQRFFPDGQTPSLTPDVIRQFAYEASGATGGPEAALQRAFHRV